MKGAFVLLVLVLAVAAEKNGFKSPVYDYHRREGIPRANQIRAHEQNPEFSSSASRIVGGNAIDISNAPYQIGLVMRILWIFQSVCGASLISNTRAITAAHCKYDGSITAQDVTVVLGSNTLFTGGERYTLLPDEVVMHPGWDYAMVENDIAIIRLPFITYTNVIQPIALPTGAELSMDFVGQSALASGFGATADGSNIGLNQFLRAVSLPVIPNGECAQVYGPYVKDTNICVSGADGKSTCGGDSGGPLVASVNNRQILIGVTSYGHIDGCEVGYPAAFARTTTFIDFIYSV